MSRRYMKAVFDDEVRVVEAVRELSARGYVPDEILAPYPVHGLDQAAGLSRSRLGWVCAIAGFFAAGSMLFFQVWTSSIAWAVNVGGKPFASYPAFVPVMFEIGVLAGGLSTVAAFLFRSRLYPGKQAFTADELVTDGNFVVLLEEKNAAFDAELLRDLFSRHAAIKVEQRLLEVAA